MVISRVSVTLILVRAKMQDSMIILHSIRFIRRSSSITVLK